VLQCIVCNSSSILFMHTIQASWLSGWCAGVGIRCPRGTGSIPVVTSYLVLDGVSGVTVSSARVDPALNGYLGKVSRKGV